MNDEEMMTVMNLIVDAGDAKSCAMEAIQLAKSGDFEAAKLSLNNSNEAISRSHEAQTGLIQKAAAGEPVPLNLFLVHAQDHIMTAILAKDLATEIVELYEKK